MEFFLIALAVIAATGVVFFLFVMEPRRKIYDYDPHPPVRSHSHLARIDGENLSVQDTTASGGISGR